MVQCLVGKKFLATAALVVAVLDAHAKSATEFVNTIMAQPIEAAVSNLPSFFENNVPIPDFFAEIATNSSFRADDLFAYSATNSFDATNYSNELNHVHEANNLRCILQRSGRVADSAANRLAQSNYYHRLWQLAGDIEQSGTLTNQVIDRLLFREILGTYFAYPVLDHETTIGPLSYAVTNGAAIPPESITTNDSDLIKAIATNGTFRILGKDVPYCDSFCGETNHVDLVVSTTLAANPVVFLINLHRYGDQNATIVDMYREGCLGDALAEGVMEACWRSRLHSPCPIILISSEQEEHLHAYGGTIRGSGLLFISGTPVEIVKKLANWR